MADPSAKSRYDRLASDRSQFLQRARHNALLTIPSLMPLDGQAENSHLIEPYQGVGARGMVHLPSRLLMGMFPAGRPYMRLDLPPETKLKQGGDVSVDVQVGLALAEQLVQSEVESRGWREATLMSLQQLMVAGSVIEYILPDNSIRIFRLDQFVVRRDHLGRPLEIIIEEKFKKDQAPPELTIPDGIAADEDIALYTVINLVKERNREFYRRRQELSDGTPVGSTATWDTNKMPYLCLRWTMTPGEDYGRSKIEEHIADLRSLDALEKAQLEMAGMASRNFIMVAPGANSASLKRRLVRALNGDVVVGDPEGVDLKSFDNTTGYQVTSAQVEVLRESLSSAFLLMSGSQRNAERVTAREIERDIQELEAALGGVFSTLSKDMQEARTRILMFQMQEQGRLPDFPEGAVVPVILTGLEALSRERDVSRAMQAAEVAGAFGESAFDVVKLDKILGRAFIGLGFPDSVRSEDEAAEFRNQRMQQELMTKGMSDSMPGVAKEIAKKEVENSE